MEEKDNDAVLLFDTLYTTNHIQMLKVLIPYLQEDMRTNIAIYIKFQEFQYTLEYTKKHNVSLYSQSERGLKDLDISKIYNSIKPYCTESEKQMLSKIMSFKNGFEKYQEFAKIMPLLENMSGNKEDSSGNFNMNMILNNFLSEEQVAMFKMFQEGGII